MSVPVLFEFLSGFVTKKYDWSRVSNVVVQIGLHVLLSVKKIANTTFIERYAHCHGPKLKIEVLKCHTIILALFSVITIFRDHLECQLLF